MNSRRFPPALLVVLLLLFGGWDPPPAHAQDATLEGTVRDAEDQQPLPGASVIVMPEGGGEVVAGSATDPQGRYSVSGINPGTYTVNVRFVGYRALEETLTLSAGETRTLNADLQPEDVGLNPVVVTASRQREKALDAPASVSVLDAQDIQQDAVPSSALTLRNTPGVDIARSGLDRYQISLRGFNSAFVSKTFVLADYRQTTVPSLSINAFNSMPISPLDVAQIEVVRGPGSALYGPGVEQGVIHFITKQPLSDPGTSVMLGGGQQQMVQSSLRHAGNVNDTFGYEVVGYYSTGEDWKMDPNDPRDADVLDAIAPNKLDQEGNVIGSLGSRSYKSENGYVSGTLQYQPSLGTTITATGGYASVTNTNLANTGENRLENFSLAYGQIRLRTGGLFAQGFINRNDAGDTFFYRSGRPVIDESFQMAGQVQYEFDFSDGAQRFTVGGDVDRTVPRTEGSIHGRFDGRDEITELGGYAQSEIDLTDAFTFVGTARVDWDDVIEKAQFSPRAALVYKPTPEQTLRATYNRAFSTPAGINLFIDLFIEDRGPFTVRGRGAVDGWSFADQTTTSSLIPGVGRYTGVGMPLQAAYSAAVAGLTGEDGPLPAALAPALEAKLAEISGFSQGALTNAEGEPVEGVRDLPPLGQTVTNSFEIGYKGVLGDRLLVNVDGYYTKKTNFISELRPITPLVSAPNIATDLVNAVDGAFSDAELQAIGLTREQLLAAFRGAGQQIASNPVGLVEPEENVAARQAAGQSRPELMLTYVNFGDIDFFGTDIAVRYRATDNIEVFGNYSGMSDSFFDPEETGEEETGLVASMNAPQHKVRFGASYSQPNGFSFNAAGRWRDGFEVRSGVHNGRVNDVFVLDLGAGYDFGEYVPGDVRLDVSAQNVLNNRHRQYVNAPELGRLVTTRLTYSF